MRESPTRGEITVSELPLLDYEYNLMICCTIG